MLFKDWMEKNKQHDIENQSNPGNTMVSSSHDGQEQNMTEEDAQAVQSIFSLSEETYEEVI